MLQIAVLLRSLHCSFLERVVSARAKMVLEPRRHCFGNFCLFCPVQSKIIIFSRSFIVKISVGRYLLIIWKWFFIVKQNYILVDELLLLLRLDCKFSQIRNLFAHGKNARKPADIARKEASSTLTTTPWLKRSANNHHRRQPSPSPMPSPR